MEAIITGLATGITTLLGLIVAVIYLLNRIDSRIDAAKTEFRAEIDAAKTELRTEIREQGARVSAVQLEQARLDGYNNALAQMVMQQSHTHEAAD